MPSSGTSNAGGSRALPSVHPPTHMIWGMAFSPDGRRLATCCDDGRARWWDVATGKPIGKPLVHGNEQGYYTLALSPDGRVLATGGKDMRVIRWDAATGEQIGAPLFCNGRVHMLAFLRDGRRFVTGTRDGALQIWDPDNSRMSELPSQGTSVTGLAVSPDGKTFATGTAGGVLRLWDPSCLGTDRGNLRACRRRDRTRLPSRRPITGRRTKRWNAPAVGDTTIQGHRTGT